MHTHLNRRILIVDDNRAIHQDFKKILAAKTDTKSYGELTAELFGEKPEPDSFASFEIDSAYQGQEGLQAVSQALAAGRPYALAFIDVRMPPGWDGIETIARIWAVDPALQVVICTAYSDYSWSEVAHQLGKNDRLLILKKPFDVVEVLQLAETLAQKWTLARQAGLRLAELDDMVAQRTRELRAASETLAQEIVERSQTQLRLSAFSTLGSLLNTTRTVREAGHVIVETADRLLGWDACMVDAYSPETDIITDVLHVDLIEGKRTELKPDVAMGRPSARARRTIQAGGQLILNRDLDRMGMESKPFGDTNRRSASIMVVPIRNGATVSGILSIQSYTPNAYDERSLETLQALADHCGGALDRIRIEENLHQVEEQLRQSQKLEAIGQLASGVAHDFNNLLAVISANAGLALMEASTLPCEVVEFLNEISAAGDRAANLTRQLLAFSRKQMMRSQPLDLNATLKNVGKMLERIIGEHIALRCDYADALPLVLADAGMLEQVLVNLAVNARDAMPEGGQLLITTQQTSFAEAPDPAHPEARPGEFLRLTVQDSGTGISPENLPHIFNPFFTTKAVGKGTGLGLATVYGIVKQHQGWVEVSSRVGTGTAFKIHLPALKCARAPSACVAPGVASPRGRETVLLVEDERAVRAATRLILERSGYRVLEADSGAEALKIWDSAAPDVDLLLTDVIMPAGFSGRRLAETLLGKKPALKVIFHTGYGGEVMRDADEFMRRTHSCLLQKPCAPRTLIATVRRCLDGLPNEPKRASVTA